jgi:hypothetical protein
MAYRGFRPDLMARIRRAIEDSREPTVSAASLSALLEEPAWQVLECLVRLVDWGALDPPNPPSDPRALKKARLRYRKPKGKNPESAEYPIREWAPKADAPPAQLKPSALCPKCGRPIKRRHGRGEFHNPDKCLMDNIRDIHDL